MKRLIQAVTVVAVAYLMANVLNGCAPQSNTLPTIRTYQPDQRQAYD